MGESMNIDRLRFLTAAAAAAALLTGCGSAGSGADAAQDSAAGSAATVQGGNTELPVSAIVLERQGAFAVGGTILGDAATSSLHCDHGVVEF
jgi:hypothetical protein